MAAAIRLATSYNDMQAEITNNMHASPYVSGSVRIQRGTRSNMKLIEFHRFPVDSSHTVASKCRD